MITIEPKFVIENHFKSAELASAMKWNALESILGREPALSEYIDKFGQKDIKNLKRFKKNNKLDKREYLTGVFLTNEEYKKLEEIIGVGIVDRFIEDLSVYLLRTGKVYRSHYQTIRKWHQKENIQSKRAKIENDDIIKAFSSILGGEDAKNELLPYAGQPEKRRDARNGCEKSHRLEQSKIWDIL